MCFPNEMLFFTEMGIVSTALWGPLPKPATKYESSRCWGEGAAGGVGKSFYRGSDGN